MYYFFQVSSSIKIIWNKNVVSAKNKNISTKMQKMHQTHWKMTVGTYNQKLLKNVKDTK